MTSFYFLGTNSRKDITLVFAQELGLVDFVLEGDSEVVINSLRSNEVSFSSFGHLLESAKSMLVSSTCIKFPMYVEVVIKQPITQLDMQEMSEVCLCGWKIFHHTQLMYSLSNLADFIKVIIFILKKKKRLKRYNVVQLER